MNALLSIYKFCLDNYSTFKRLLLRRHDKSMYPSLMKSGLGLNTFDFFSFYVFFFFFRLYNRKTIQQRALDAVKTPSQHWLALCTRML